MKMLEQCIDETFEKSQLTDNENDKELYKSIYYHLSDYKDILNKTIELDNEIRGISERWQLINRINDKNKI